MQTELSDILLQRPAKSKVYLGHVFPWAKQNLIIKSCRHTAEEISTIIFSMHLICWDKWICKIVIEADVCSWKKCELEFRAASWILATTDLEYSLS